MVQGAESGTDFFREVLVRHNTLHRGMLSFVLKHDLLQQLGLEVHQATG